MEYIAQIAGITLLTLGLGMLTSPKYYQKIAEEMAKHQPLFLLTALTLLVFGLTMIRVHNVWDGSWQNIIVTITGWATFLTGVITALIPGLTKFIVNYWAKNSKIVYLEGASLSIAGILLSFIGFM